MPNPKLATEASHGARKRARILAAAADVGTAEGLEGLSIARLAAEVGMSKSGVAAHFASKQALQLAAVELAAGGYARGVFEAARGSEPGIERLQSMMEAWLEYIECIEYRGGCFFAATGNEFASRPGAVRDRVAAHTRALLDTLDAEARLAARLGELPPEVDPHLLVFQLHAIVQEANLRRQLLADEGAFDDARAAMAAVLPTEPVPPAASVPSGRAVRRSERQGDPQ